MILLKSCLLANLVLKNHLAILIMIVLIIYVEAVILNLLLQKVQKSNVYIEVFNM